MEGTVRHGLTRSRRAARGASLQLEVASRTDRGVSARGNALTLVSPLSGPTLLRSLNGIDPNVFFTAATEIPSDFRVRRPTRRVYRYYSAEPFLRYDRVEQAARLFSGEVDVRSFGRAIPAGAPALRTVEHVRVHGSEEGCEIEIAAPSFVWGMVRKMVAALREVDSGRLTVPRLRSALEGSVRLSLPMADPEPLVLWDVEYPLSWKFRWTGPNRAQTAARMRRESRLRTERRLILALEP